MTNTTPAPLWRPDAARVENARLTHYQRWLSAEKGLAFDDYQSLWAWSVEHLEDFYESLWQYFDIRHSAPYERVLDGLTMPGAKWFEGARLNLAEQVFRHHENEPDRPAILSRSELRGLETLTWGELRGRIAALAHSLREMGVGPGDRVVAYLPNLPETMVAFFAVSSLGAIWSSCSPDMGTRSVLDRFRQIDPKVMIAVDGYRYGGKDFDRLTVVEGLRDQLPTLETVVLLPYLNADARLDGALLWDDLVSQEAPMRFEQVPFDHPLWVVYSSGTTGMPKPIVHGHGGALLEGLQDHALQLDLGPRDRYMWFTTTGWIMWNSQMSGLLTGATICLYDGNPGYPDLGTLWRFAEETEMTFFGAGAAYFLNCKKADIRPGDWVDTGRIRSIGSTGSPLPEEGYRWLMDQFDDVMIAAISGGTDVASAYVGASPTLPVFAGEMQCRYLGTAVYAMGDNGELLDDEVGELVVTKPMPSMPLYFWNDEGGERYRDSYFDVFPGIWRHGDWIRITPRGGAIIYGRSDTTINRHGIRMGTAEIYRVVEEFDEVLDSLVVDLEYLGRESYMPLFVVLREGVTLDEALSGRIKAAIRDHLSARHVPNDIIAAPDVPRTLTGKKMELPIKKLLLGQTIDKVANPDAMANPDSIAFYSAFAEQKGTAGR
ncbi:acetoacetate--CoA ligase [Alcanivorax marinus]|uniref:Acetoacetate--CoA ligase n=1 Tax=Alloalcanivorax marinus TaxID=1177169 RepID=A0A9Q3UL42_9GAMM|nr:acetoacetate--CoA ligase [Alloalcanivorax marinus]MCC4308982.1 acetoacetate--CoA ligase [Alloalcanivorax marinus]MCU5788052.1 acetoacetyl-CoA synthetase [Alloalcanivorax marinus]